MGTRNECARLFHPADFISVPLIQSKYLVQVDTPPADIFGPAISESNVISPLQVLGPKVKEVHLALPGGKENDPDMKWAAEIAALEAFNEFSHSIDLSGYTTEKLNDMRFKIFVEFDRTSLVLETQNPHHLTDVLYHQFLVTIREGNYNGLYRVIAKQTGHNFRLVEMTYLPGVMTYLSQMMQGPASDRVGIKH